MRIHLHRVSCWRHLHRLGFLWSGVLGGFRTVGSSSGMKPLASHSREPVGCFCHGWMTAAYAVSMLLSVPSRHQLRLVARWGDSVHTKPCYRIDNRKSFSPKPLELNLSVIVDFKPSRAIYLQDRDTSAKAANRLKKFLLQSSASQVCPHALGAMSSTSLVIFIKYVW